MWGNKCFYLLLGDDAVVLKAGVTLLLAIDFSAGVTVLLARDFSACVTVLLALDCLPRALFLINMDFPRICLVN